MAIAPTPYHMSLSDMQASNSANAMRPGANYNQYSQADLQRGQEESDRRYSLQLAAAGQNGVSIGYNPYKKSGNGGGGGTVSVSGGTASVVPQEQIDPWSKYRAASGDRLAAASADPNQGPTGFYQSRLQEMLTPGSQFQPDDPSYQFRLQQGQQATERSLAAKGLLNSGNAAIELQNYGQQAASQEYGAQFNRLVQGLGAVSSTYDSQMNRLMQMAGVSQDAAKPWEVANQTTQANASMINAQANMVGAQKATTSSGWNSPIFSVV